MDSTSMSGAPRVLAGVLLTSALFLAEAALAGYATGIPFDMGCTHGCHPGDPEFLPCLALLVGAAGGAHALISRSGLRSLSGRVVGTSAGLFALDWVLDRFYWDSPVSYAPVVLVASVVWIAGAIAVRGARGLVRARSRAGA